MGIAKQLTEAQREAIARSLYKITDHDRKKGELHGLCPIHGEKNPSFAYNYKKDQFYCLACGASGDLVKLYCRVKGLDDKSGFKAFCDQYGIKTGRSRPPSPEKKTPPEDVSGDNLDAVFEKFPHLPDPWLARLEKIRGWSRETIESLDIRQQTWYRRKSDGVLVKIGKPERVAIPIRDKGGRVRNIRLYKPGAKKMKIISWGKGYGKCRLFPAEPLQDGPVLLCEGEQDTICAISHGFNAITQTVKRKTWPKNQKEVFRGRDVVIAYDADQAGEHYADSAAKALSGVAASVKILTWPDDMGRRKDGTWPKDKGQDLTDFFVKHGRTAADLQDLIDQAAPYEQDSPPDGDYMEFFEPGASGRVSFKPIRLAERILKDTPIITDPQTGQIYQWNDRYWENIADEYIAGMCIKLLGPEAQQSRVKDAVFLVRNMAVIPRDRELNDRHEWVCLKNCMFNLHTGETRPHDRNFYHTMALGIDFDPDHSVRCDRWMRFLRETIQTPEVINQAQEFAGYCLTRDTRFEKCLLLTGPGADGKSKFLNVLRLLAGPENTSAISFQDMEDQFLRSSLYGKLLNISSEIGNRAMESQYFKAIVSGDPISAAFKHKNTFTFTPYCKLAFAANKLPRVLDNSDGFFRRVLPIKFKRQFLNDDEKDVYLDEALTAELPGIFKWAVAGLHRLLRQKAFTDCRETRDLLMSYRRLNNPVVCFVEDKCILGDEVEVSKDDLYNAFRTYCAANGYTPFHKENFLRELYAAVANIRRYRPTVDGKRVYMIKGIGLDGLDFNGNAV